MIARIRSVFVVLMLVAAAVQAQEPIPVTDTAPRVASPRAVTPIVPASTRDATSVAVAMAKSAAWFGIVRKIDPTNTAPLTAAGNMTYHGDLFDSDAVQHAQKVYTIFWSPPGTSFPAGYQTTINQFVQDLNGSSYYAIASQYDDWAGHIGIALSYGGTWLDTTNPYPASLTNQPLDSSHSDAFGPTLIDEVNRAKAANGWTSDGNSYFQVFTTSG